MSPLDRLDGPSLLDLEPTPLPQLPDPYRCDSPWCASSWPQGPEGPQVTHLHGTRPDGVRA